MFCSRSKSAQPNSSDELVPQASSTTYELIGCVGENSVSCNCCHHHKFNAHSLFLTLNLTLYIPLSPCIYPKHCGFDPCNTLQQTWELEVFRIQMLPFPRGTRYKKLASLMDKEAEMHKSLQNNPVRTAVSMPPTSYPAGVLTASVCHPPSFPLQYNENSQGSKCEGE